MTKESDTGHNDLNTKMRDNNGQSLSDFQDNKEDINIT
jgi:hypothetical protein